MLTRDPALAGILKALGSDHNIVTVKAESDLAGELVGTHMGVAIIDTGAVASAVGQLTEQLKSQFPDLVLIVAGSVNDQTALAAQITNGIVYRFLHKPVSDQRVRLMVDAAWRRHGEGLSGGAPDSAGPVGTLPDERAPLPRPVLFIGGAVVIALLATGGWYLTRKSTPAPAANTVAPTVRDEQFESLLTRADAALASGALVAPPGQNAVDLYKQALHRNGSDPRPAAGIENVIGKLLSAAEDQLSTQHLDEAQKLTDQARALQPDHLRVAFLSTQIGKARERFVLNQARQAASSGNIEGAIAVLDGANQDDKHSAPAADARQELEQQKLNDRVNEYLAKASERLGDGQLIEPAQDNARFFIESARAIAPDEPQVQQAQKQLEERLVTEARKSLAGGNAQAAQHWIDAAADSGVSRDEISDLTKETQRVQMSAKADAMLAEAKAAVQRQDYVGARRWLIEAHDAGMDDASISAVEHDMTVAQDNAKRATEVVPAATLELAKYVPPVFPVLARQRGLTGWVDVQLHVKGDGSVSDVIIMGAEPVGVFEQAAVDAVKKWRYKPVERDGHAVDQRARLRMKFALD